MLRCSSSDHFSFMLHGIRDIHPAPWKESLQNALTPLERLLRLFMTLLGFTPFSELGASYSFRNGIIVVVTVLIRWYNTTYIMFAASIILLRITRLDAMPETKSLLKNIDMAIEILDAMDECVVAKKSAELIRFTLTEFNRSTEAAASADILPLCPTAADSQLPSMGYTFSVSSRSYYPTTANVALTVCYRTSNGGLILLIIPLRAWRVCSTIFMALPPTIHSRVFPPPFSIFLPEQKGSRVIVEQEPCSK